MRRILILLLTVSLFSIQQNNLHAQTDSTPPERAPPETVPEEEPETEETPTGEPAPVEESNSGGGSSGGGGAIIAIGAVAVVLMITNNRNKLEKTFTADSTTGSALTNLSGINKKQLEWSIDYGLMSHSLAQGLDKTADQQQVLNWRINRSWESGWKLNSNFGLAHSLDTQGDIQRREWFSVGVNKSGLFKSNDSLNFSLGQRLDHKTKRSIDNGYFLPTTLAAMTNTEMFDLSKNTTGNGRYLNLSYIRPISAQSALNWQWQYNPKQLGDRSSDSYMTVSWQFRY